MSQENLNIHQQNSNNSSATNGQQQQQQQTTVAHPTISNVNLELNSSVGNTFLSSSNVKQEEAAPLMSQAHRVSIVNSSLPASLSSAVGKMDANGAHVAAVSVNSPPMGVQVSGTSVTTNNSESLSAKPPVAESGDETEEENEEVEHSPGGRWSKRNQPVTQRDVPGIDKAYLAMDTENGYEVVWNEINISNGKKFKNTNNINKDEVGGFFIWFYLVSNKKWTSCWRFFLIILKILGTYLTEVDSFNRYTRNELGAQLHKRDSVRIQY